VVGRVAGNCCSRKPCLRWVSSCKRANGVAVASTVCPKEGVNLKVSKGRGKLTAEGGGPAMVHLAISFTTKAHERLSHLI